MNMDKVKNKLKEKNVPDEIINFIESCLREKQTVEVEIEGKKIVDQ